jgi:superfamily II RNA helicase
MPRGSRRDRHGPAHRAAPSETPISGGDFVRNVKQLVDLLRQIASVAAGERLGGTARSAAETLVRGIVAASSGPPALDEPEVGDGP